MLRIFNAATSVEMMGQSRSGLLIITLPGLVGATPCAQLLSLDRLPWMKLERQGFLGIAYSADQFQGLGERGNGFFGKI